MFTLGEAAVTFPKLINWRLLMRLFISALTKYLFGLLLVGALVFLPAGGLAFVNGWLFICLLFVPMLFLGAFLLIKRPDLLEKRLSAKESEGAQKGVVALSAVMFIGGFVVAGLDFRFGWSRVPAWAVISAAVILLVSYALYAEVMRENAYLSRTVEVQENQKIVDTGLYGIVRHPMYAVTLWLFLAIPVVLGSLWSLCCFAPYVILLVVRIINEEKVLEAGLVGYTEYKKKVRYRLIPFIW
jgi:protein-S-isoprenylcysteine O-methyltransferase Ste14